MISGNWKLDDCIAHPICACVGILSSEKREEEIEFLIFNFMWVSWTYCKYIKFYFFLTDSRWNVTVNIRTSMKIYQKEHFLNVCSELLLNLQKSKLKLSFISCLNLHFFTFWFDFFLLMKNFNVLKDRMQMKKACT
jgi:hypothetical protein